MITSAELERIRNSDLPSSARHIFLELSLRANKQGECWPSVLTIAHDTGYSERQVRKMIKLLEKHKWIQIEHRKQTSNKYHIRPIDAGDGIPIPAPRSAAPAPRSATIPAPRSAAPAPRSAKALQETEIPIHEDLKDHNEGIDQIRRAWQDRNPPYFQLNINQARQLMDRYTAAEIIDAINSYKHANDLNPDLLGFRVEFLRENAKKKAKRRQKRRQKRG